MMNRSSSFILAGLILAAGLIAHGQEVVRKEVVYKTIKGDSLKTDLFFLTESQDTVRPAIAFFHGGGWSSGSPSEFHEACIRYARKGFITFSFHYRLSKKEDGSIPHPDITPVECVKDARSAMRWIREHAEELQIDSHKIVACGQSAGGHLALSTALFEDINEATDRLDVSPVPNAIVLYSATANLLEAWADRLLGDRREEIWSISPYHNLKSGLPPTIAFHGEEDCMVPFWTVRFFESKTRELGNDYSLVPYQGRKHYLGDGDDQYGRYYDEEILKRTDEFLMEHGFLKPDVK